MNAVGCLKCKLPRCACFYIKELLEGKHGEKVRAIAAKQMDQPKPHRAGCPCPSCWSARANSWDEWSNNYGKF